MKSGEYHHYKQVAAAIEYIRQHFREQPGLDEVAAHIHMSPFHFQRLFTEWAGVSPKKFLQYTSVQYAKQLLKEKQATLFDAAIDTGLSGTGRLHDLFILVEGMTPGEYKNGGENLDISYSFAESPFGPLMVASTARGICQMSFADQPQVALDRLKSDFPRARINERYDPVQETVLAAFSGELDNSNKIRLHLKGTSFQLKVWEALLKIPAGALSTYGRIAEEIQSSGASRAVGTAIGSNPVAFLVPCHRVIQSGGAFGGYMWGPERKTAMIGWEIARTQVPEAQEG